MIEDLITRIDTLFGGVTEVTVNTRDGLSTVTSFNQGATGDEVLEIYNFFDGQLPSDYLSLLSYSNGFALFKWDVGGMEFLNTKELIQTNLSQRVEFGEQWDNSIVSICAILGEGDFIGIRMLDHSSYQILDCYQHEWPADWKCIETSLEIFIDNLLKHEGEKYWLGMI